MNFIFIRHVYLQEKIDVLEKTVYGYYSVFTTPESFFAAAKIIPD